MKKITLLLLLLATTISFGQTTLANKLKITGNISSTTATKVNVQESNGEVNTISKSDLVNVETYASAVNLPATGLVGKIYITNDDNKIYRWNGTIYQPLAITDISGKANIASPTFTGTVSGITASMVGLGNVNNTTDLLKPISTATQTALDLKVDKVANKSLILDSEITRLGTLANYTHPANHPPSIITQDASNRFVTDTEKATWNAKQGALGYTAENVANKGISNGYASLDSNAKVPLSQINDALLGSVNYKGTYNASTNSPALPAATNKGFYYVVSTAGTQQGLNLVSGDWIISDGTSWGKVDNNNAVTSVNGQVGSVSLSTSNIAEGSNLYYSDARVTNNSAVAANTAKVGITTTQANNITANNAKISFDSTSSTRLANTSGTNTGDNATNTQYSGLVSNATHTGDATGATVLTLATVNANVGVFGTASNVAQSTVNAKGLTTAIANVPIQIAQSQVNSLVSDLAGKQATLTNPVTGTGTTNYLPKFSGVSSLGNSQIFDNGTNVGIGTTTPTSMPGFSKTLQVSNTSDSSIRLTGAAGSWEIGNNSANTLQFYRNASSVALSMDNSTGAAIFSSSVTANATGETFRSVNVVNSPKSLRLSNGGADVYFGIDDSTGSFFGRGNSSSVIYSPTTNFSVISPNFSLTNTGAAAFSSSVTANRIDATNNNATGGNQLVITNTNTANTGKTSDITFKMSDSAGTIKDAGYIKSVPADINLSIGANLIFYNRSGDTTPIESFRINSNNSATFSSSVTARNFNFANGSTGIIGLVTAESSLGGRSADGTTFGYGVSTNNNGGLDIMANQAGQPIRFWAGTTNVNPIQRMIINGDGTVNIASNVTATAFFQSSDRRLKTILKRDGDVAYFKWKDGRDNLKHIGYIAQEVKKEFPDQVQKDEKGMLSVNYIEVLVAKIQALEKRISELEKN